MKTTTFNSRTLNAATYQTGAYGLAEAAEAAAIEAAEKFSGLANDAKKGITAIKQRCEGVRWGLVGIYALGALIVLLQLF